MLKIRKNCNFPFPLKVNNLRLVILYETLWNKILKNFIDFGRNLKIEFSYKISNFQRLLGKGK